MGTTRLKSTNIGLLVDLVEVKSVSRRLSQLKLIILDVSSRIKHGVVFYNEH